MSTKLKLTGVASFMSVLLGNIHILKGNVIQVDDSVAGKIGGLHRMSDHDGIKVFFFTEPKANEPVTYDFTAPEAPAQKAPAQIEAETAPPKPKQAADDSEEDFDPDTYLDQDGAGAGAAKVETPAEAAAPAPAQAPAPEPAEAPARPVQRVRTAPKKARE